MDASYPELEAREAHEQLERFHVVDVREVPEFHGPLGRIEGAELVPLASLTEQAERLADAGPLLLVCRSGKRSGLACDRLRAAGVETVTNLAGGMIDWNRAGLPVERAHPRDGVALLDQIVEWVAQVGPRTEEETYAWATQLLSDRGASKEAPTSAALQAVIEAIDEGLAGARPVDRDLSVASFRRSLEAL